MQGFAVLASLLHSHFTNLSVLTPTTYIWDKSDFYIRILRNSFKCSRISEIWTNFYLWYLNKFLIRLKYWSRVKVDNGFNSILTMDLLFAQMFIQILFSRTTFRACLRWEYLGMEPRTGKSGFVLFMKIVMGE